MSAALHRSIPSGPMAPALRDWHTANQLSRDSFSFADEGVEGAASVLLGKKRLSSKEIFFLDRIRARRNAKGVPDIMKSLAAFANENVHDSPSNAVNPSRKWGNLLTKSNLRTNTDSLLGESFDDVPSDQEKPLASEDKVD